MIGVKIAFWFVQMNLKSEENRGDLDPPSQELSDSESEDNDYSEQEESYDNPVLSHTYRRRHGGQKQVLFCGPSNSSVDVAASKSMVVEVISSCFFLQNLVQICTLLIEPLSFCWSSGNLQLLRVACGLFGSALGL